MDYNDSDYQNQHFQLGGEDNNNFLRPFSLPKFDLDEHLQVHLRFDGIDEPEDILGIRDQEGNNWIQDFPSGSRGIEFSSGAAESCTISRQNNIWSEATSTESVEMLLKSVGEDDMLKNKATTGSVSDEVVNNANNDTSSDLPNDDSCLVDVIKAESPPTKNYSSPGILRDSLIPSSHVNIGQQLPGDGKFDWKDPKDLEKSLTNEGSGKILEGESSNLSPYIHGESHEEATEDCSLNNSYLHSSASYNLERSAEGKDSHMMHLSNMQIDFDDPLNIDIIDRAVSIVPSSQRSNSDTKVCSEDLQSEQLEVLKSQKQEHQLLPSVKCIGHCHPDGSLLGSRSSSSGVPSSSVVLVNSSDLMTVCKESVHSGGTDGLLEVIIDDVKFSKNGSDALASQIEEHQLSLNSETVKHDAEMHSIVGSCIIEKSTILGTQDVSSQLTNGSEETVHCNQADGLLEVIIDGVKFINKSNELRELECDPVQRSKECSPPTYSPKEMESSTVVSLLDKSYDSPQNFGREGDQVALITLKGENDLRNFDGRSDYRQECSELPLKICNETERVEETQTSGAERSAELESQEHLSNIMNKHGDDKLENYIGFSDTGVNDYEKEAKVSANSPDPSINAGASLLSPGNVDPMEGSIDDNKGPSCSPHEEGARPYVGAALLSPDNADLVEVYHSCSADDDKVPLGSSYAEGARPIVGPGVEDPDYNGSATSMKSMDLVPRVCDASMPSVLEKLISETKSDIATENLPSFDMQDISAEFKDVEQSSDTTSVTESQKEKAMVSCIANSDLACNDQNDAKLSGGLKEPGVPIHEDSFQFAPYNDFPSQKESSIPESIGDVTRGGSPSAGRGNNFDDKSPMSASTKCALVTQPSESSVCEPNTLVHNDDPSPVISSSHHCHGDVEKQDIIKGFSHPSSSILGDLHTKITEKILEQDKSTHENLKESCATPDDICKPVSDSQSQKYVPEICTSTGVDKQNSALVEKATSLDIEVVVNEAVNEVQIQDTVVKGTGKDKGRSAASSSGSKRKSAKESQTSRKTAEKGRKNALSSPLEELQQQPSLEGRNVKPSSSPAQPSNLPDLNSSASGVSLFSQPFTDAQQVQLRAQILVYGYLIQGIPPEEACMVSAFGDGDGGRVWEGVWRAFSEKYRNQKSPLFRTPSRTVIKPLDPLATCSPLPNRINTPACQAGSKSSAPFNSTMSLQSPIWSATSQDLQNSTISRGSLVDPSRILSPLHAYHSPQVRQYAVNVNQWPGQSPVSASLVPSSHSQVFSMNTQVSALRSGEALQLPHTKEFSAHHNSNVQLVSPGTFSSLPGTTHTVASATAMQIDAVSPSPNKQTSCEPKSRKKKKNIGLDAPKQNFIACQPIQEPVSASGQSRLLGFPTSVSLLNKATTDGLVSNAYPVLSPAPFQVVGSGHLDRFILSEETCTKIEQARQQAEDAAVSASTAVRHSEGIWSHLALQRNSGLVSEVEQKLACAAVAAAAAASVAKAAAAAAKVAADAALQAKLITDDVLASNKAIKAPAGVEADHQQRESCAVNVVRGSDSIHNDIASNSCSIISAAREGVRKRVEAASAAAKRAEILDAIVKAAELASGAVSQAGALVAMGDPLPFNLNEILDAGPQSYWKGQQSKKDVLAKEHTYSGIQIAKNDVDSQEKSVGHPSFLPLNREETHHPDKDENVQTLNDLVSKPVETSTELTPPGNGGLGGRFVVDANDHIIKEGSIVEISSDNGLGSIWYSARVLNIKDGQAYVCYNTLVADEGSGKLKAWVPLKGLGDRAPRIRVAHPRTTVKNEGTRKRRRDAVTMHSWNVGDRVDAWIRDGWSEGVITAKSSEDETKLTVCFSAGGDLSIVRSWDLRPSLVWKEGAWVEWSSLKENKLLPSEDNVQHDTPKEKRQKLNGPREKNPTESEGLGVHIPFKNNVSNDSGKPDNHPTLLLSDKEQIFSIGKSSQEEISSDKGKQTALQKQNSGVIFGVPRPGKKRKFMDVSKQCVVDNREKVKEGCSNIKFAKYLMPQSSHGWKMAPKVDQREKRVTTSKARTTKTAKSLVTHSRKAIGASSDGGSTRGPFSSELSSTSHADKKLEQNIHLEVSLSNSMRPSDDPVPVSQSHTMPEVADGEAEHTRKGKLGANDKASGSDDKSSSIFDSGRTPGASEPRRYKSSSIFDSGRTAGASEPRRSNRRIQPTSRLLEGLQSSLMISKIPSAPQDKGTKPAPRGALATRGRTLRTRG